MDSKSKDQEVSWVSPYGTSNAAEEDSYFPVLLIRPFY